MVDSVESGKISTSSSKWKIGLDREEYVAWLAKNSKIKIEKLINYYLDTIINTSSKHMSIRSCLVSQPNDKLIPNNEHKFYSTVSL